MYIQIGQNTVVTEESIIGVFDIDNTTSSHLTRKFLNAAEKAGNVINISEDIPKSFVLCCENGKMTIYLSQLLPSTLSRRAEAKQF